MLAGLHLAGQSHGRRQENPRGAGAPPPRRCCGPSACRRTDPVDAEIAFQATIDVAPFRPPARSTPISSATTC